MLDRIQPRTPTPLLASFTILTLLIAFLLIPASTPLWNHLPNLAFLQFPWRLLTILCAVLAFALALLLRRVPDRALIAAPICVLALTAVCAHLYRQGCAATDLPIYAATSLQTRHGAPPTDEYTPADADNDELRPNDPPFWLSPDPKAFAPNTTPNPGSSNPNFDGNFPPDETISAPAPRHFTIHNETTDYLILNLRDYPNWQVSTGCPTCIFFKILPHNPRDDGLIALPLASPGDYPITIAWRTSRDQQLGDLITALALIALAWTSYRHRSAGASPTR